MSNANVFSRRTVIAAIAIAAAGSVAVADASAKELKIGFVGVTSGPAAAWGTSNVRSM
jgi:branched-chain amino acid transport system substrate-binding protein